MTHQHWIEKFRKFLSLNHNCNKNLEKKASHPGKNICINVALCSFAVLIIAAVFMFLPKNTWNRPEVQDGVIDLTRWDFFSQGIITLDGQWEFYRSKFIQPDALSAGAMAPDATVNVPAIWNNYRVNGSSVSGRGYATYHVKIKVKNPMEEIGLKLPTVSSAYLLYANGELIASAGVVGESEAVHRPAYKPQIVSIVPYSDEIDLLMQVSNFSYARGGIWYSIYAGKPEQMVDMYEKGIIKDTFLVGALLIMAIYYFSLYLARKEEKSYIYFVSLCVVGIIRTMLYGSYLIFRFPGVTYEMKVFLEYMTIYWGSFCFAKMVSYMHPIEGNRIILRFFFYVAMAQTLFSLVTPLYVYTGLLPFHEAVMFGLIGYIFMVVIRAIYKKKSGMIALLSVMIINALAILHDVLYQGVYFTTWVGELSSYGIFILVTVQSVILAREFSYTYKTADKAFANEMAFLQAQIKPHFIYNALNTIAYFCETDPQRANDLVLFLSRYLRGNFDFANLQRSITIEQELEHVKAYVAIEKARFKNLCVEYVLEADPSLLIPPLVLQPLVENSIRHGIRPKAGGGKIVVSIKRVKNELELSVEDNGVGNTLEHLHKCTENPVQGSGVGLYNISTRLKKLYGVELQIEAECGKGTKMSITIPCEIRGNENVASNCGG